MTQTKCTLPADSKKDAFCAQARSTGDCQLLCIPEYPCSQSNQEMLTINASWANNKGRLYCTAKKREGGREKGEGGESDQSDAFPQKKNTSPQPLDRSRESRTYIENSRNLTWLKDFLRESTRHNFPLPPVPPGRHPMTKCTRIRSAAGLVWSFSKSIVGSSP